jgi:translation initiation factor IF-1
MVKNTKGGKGAKGLARKSENTGSGHTERLRLPTCELEQYACVTKMFGNGMCEIYTNGNIRLIGHIRNKFRGRQKRNNIISPNSIVMVGLREWENPIKNCDILCIFDDNQIEQLKDLPQIDIKNVLQLRNENYVNKEASTGADDIQFTNDLDDNIKNIVGEKSANTIEEFELEISNEIDVDDI